MENYQGIEELMEDKARIKVIGTGGGGGNAINHMIDEGVEGVDFCVINTDSQALRISSAPEKIQIGVKLTKGLGAGANPEVGRKAAEESIELIEKTIQDYDLIFIAAGMGGGTGTGSASVIAETARKMGILTVAVVTIPFGFEGKSRLKKAIEGKRMLAEHVDTIITIPNDRLSEYLKKQGKKLGMKKAFEEVNNVLRQAVQGITDLINKPGYINLDFADIKTIMQIGGSALMGMGTGTGEDRVREATERAIKNPLLEHGIEGAQGIILNIAGPEDLDFEDYEMVNATVTSFADDEAEIIVGTVLDETIPQDTVKVTVVATGFNEESISNTSKYQMVRLNKNNKIATETPQETTNTISVDKKIPSNEERGTKEVESIYETLGLADFIQKLER